MENLDTNRKISGIRRKPEWGTAVLAVLAPVGLGVPDSITIVSTVPGIIEFSLDMAYYIIGDDVWVTLDEQVDAANLRTLGYINIINGNIINVVGTPFYQDPATPLPAAQVPAFQWLIYIDAQTQLRVTLTQTAGILRTAAYHHNVRSELF